MTSYVTGMGRGFMGTVGFLCASGTVSMLGIAISFITVSTRRKMLKLALFSGVHPVMQ